MPFNLGFHLQNGLSPWSMYFNLVIVLLNAFAILFKTLSVDCDLGYVSPSSDEILN